MGFTHYQQQPVGSLDRETWKKFIKDCRYLSKHMPEHSHSSGDNYPNEPLAINGCFKYEKAQFTMEFIWFNGGNGSKRVFNGEDWEDTIPNGLAHETFQVNRVVKDKGRGGEEVFSFCKTARKPYDLMVQACLILFKYYFSVVEISSDGDRDDWKEAIQFVAKVLPHGKGICTELLLGELLAS